MEKINELPGKREREKLKKQNEIVGAAEKIFFKHGITGATMDQVALAAKASKATIYAYFKSKEELFYAINQRGHKILQNIITEELAKCADGMQSVLAIGRSYFRFALEQPKYYQFVAFFDGKAEDKSNEFATDQMTKIDDILRDALYKGMADGSLRQGLEAKVVSKCLWGMAAGMVQLITQKGKLIERYSGVKGDQLTNTFFKVIESSLGSKGLWRNENPENDMVPGLV